MRVLVVEEVPGDAAEASRALVEAGHQITSCHEDGGAFPCRGIVEEADCPLEHDGVDVALLVRSLPGSQPTVREDGVRCALRRRVPVAVAGEVAGNPYASMAAVVEPDLGRVVAATERAASLPLPDHGAAARTALAGVLTAEGVDASRARAEVVRSGGQLVVTLVPGVEVTPHVAETASVRVLAAVRALDPHASIIDVTLGS